MAHVRNNNLTQGLSGACGDMLVFRQYQGKTIVAHRGSRPTKQSAKQRENRNRFKMATDYAHYMMCIPERKAYYMSKAKKLKLPNAYTAAITDYMRRGEIKEINTKRYKGKTGDTIQIKTSKQDFALNEVKITICNTKGIVIESGLAIKREPHVFIYKATQTLGVGMPVKIQAELDDYGAAHSGRSEIDFEWVEKQR